MLAILTVAVIIITLIASKFYCYCLTCDRLLHSVLFMNIPLKYCLILSLYSILACHSLSGQAVVITDLYETEIPASNQSVSSRKQYMSAALRTVLIKITGDSQIISRDDIATSLANADRYVQRFEYRSNATVGKEQLSFWVQFSKILLDKMLRQVGIPQWGQERPSILIWLAVQDGSNRRLIGADDPAYVSVLDNQARDRGIILTYPLLDLQDNRQLRFSDVWGDFREIVFVASQRYSTDIVLTCRLESVSEQLWEARWVAHIEQNNISWMGQGGSPEQVLRTGVDGLVNIMAKRYALAGTYTKTDTIEIVVHEITDYNQYAKVLDYLASLNSVISVAVKGADRDSVIYFLQTQVDHSIVSSAIDLGQTLERIDPNNYRLVQ